MSVEGLFDWLVDGAPGATTPTEVVTRLGEDLVAAGVPVDRLGAFVTTLHPQVYGRSFFWHPGRGAEIREIGYEQLQAPSFVASPVFRVASEKREHRWRLGGAERPTFVVLAELATEGYTDYAGFPLVFMTGQTQAIAFATRRESGFTDADLAALRRVCRPLCRITEILALRRTATTLLSTYVGHDAGERVLAGRIQRGDIEEIRAVIWFSDLRGFTSLSQRSSARQVIDVLNDAFECQVRAVHARGGEVLKFMGDGMLAIFPLAAGADVAARCEAALAATDEARASFAALHPDLSFGIALHVGELAYGNIGGANRLDFTAIGPAVNLAARLEGLTSRLDRAVLLSEAFAQATPTLAEAAGTFELKGLDVPVQVFAPRPGARVTSTSG